MSMGSLPGISPHILAAPPTFRVFWILCSLSSTVVLVIAFRHAYSLISASEKIRRSSSNVFFGTTASCFIKIFLFFPLIALLSWLSLLALRFALMLQLLLHLYEIGCLLWFWELMCDYLNGDETACAVFALSSSLPPQMVRSLAVAASAVAQNPETPSTQCNEPHSRRYDNTTLKESSHPFKMLDPTRKGTPESSPEKTPVDLKQFKDVEDHQLVESAACSFVDTKGSETQEVELKNLSRKNTTACSTWKTERRGCTRTESWSYLLRDHEITSYESALNSTMKGNKLTQCCAAPTASAAHRLEETLATTVSAQCRSVAKMRATPYAGVKSVAVQTIENSPFEQPEPDTPPTSSARCTNCVKGTEYGSNLEQLASSVAPPLLWCSNLSATCDSKDPTNTPLPLPKSTLKSINPQYNTKGGSPMSQHGHQDSRLEQSSSMPLRTGGEARSPRMYPVTLLCAPGNGPNVGSPARLQPAGRSRPNSEAGVGNDNLSWTSSASSGSGPRGQGMQTEGDNSFREGEPQSEQWLPQNPPNQSPQNTEGGVAPPPPPSSAFAAVVSSPHHAWCGADYAAFPPSATLNDNDARRRVQLARDGDSSTFVGGILVPHVSGERVEDAALSSEGTSTPAYPGEGEHSQADSDGKLPCGYCAAHFGLGSGLAPLQPYDPFRSGREASSADVAEWCNYLQAVKFGPFAVLAAFPFCWVPGLQSRRSFTIRDLQFSYALVAQYGVFAVLAVLARAVSQGYVIHFQLMSVASLVMGMYGLMILFRATGRLIPREEARLGWKFAVIKLSVMVIKFSEVLLHYLPIISPQKEPYTRDVMRVAWTSFVINISCGPLIFAATKAYAARDIAQRYSPVRAMRSGYLIALLSGLSSSLLLATPNSTCNVLGYCSCCCCCSSGAREKLVKGGSCNCMLNTNPHGYLHAPPPAKGTTVIRPTRMRCYEGCIGVKGPVTKAKAGDAIAPPRKGRSRQYPDATTHRSWRRRRCPQSRCGYPHGALSKWQRNGMSQLATAPSITRLQDCPKPSSDSLAVTVRLTPTEKRNAGAKGDPTPASHFVCTPHEAENASKEVVASCSPPNSEQPVCSVPDAKLAAWWQRLHRRWITVKPARAFTATPQRGGRHIGATQRDKPADPPDAPPHLSTTAADEARPHLYPHDGCPHTVPSLRCRHAEVEPALNAVAVRIRAFTPNNRL